MGSIGEILKTGAKGTVGVFKAIIRGKLLMKLNFDRYYLHIIMVFIMFAIMILFGIVVDSTLTEVEQNKEILKELEIQKADRAYEIYSLERREALEKRLEDQCSSLRKPSRPIHIIKK